MNSVKRVKNFKLDMTITSAANLRAVIGNQCKKKNFSFQYFLKPITIFFFETCLLLVCIFNQMNSTKYIKNFSSKEHFVCCWFEHREIKKKKEEKKEEFFKQLWKKNVFFGSSWNFLCMLLKSFVQKSTI